MSYCISVYNESEFKLLLEADFENVKLLNLNEDIEILVLLLSRSALTLVD